MSVQVLVLGPLEIWTSERRLEVRPGKQSGLLALLLASANRPVPRDRLIDDLWEGAPPPSAAATLHSLVYRLRRVLSAGGLDGAVSLRADGPTYAVELPGAEIDLGCFKRSRSAGLEALQNGDLDRAVGALRDGLAWWRGEPLAGIDLAAVRAWSRRLERRRLDTVEQLMTAELELGRHASVVGELQALTEEHPLRERLWELLMTALTGCRRRAEALDAYQRLYRLLDDHLGVRPSEPIRSLQQQILRADDAEIAGHSTIAVGRVRPDGPTSSGSSAALPTPRQLPMDQPGFVGRTEELERLNALVAEANGIAAGAAPSVVAITGMAGIGKTTLAVHWARRIADRFPDGQLYADLHGFDHRAGAFDVGQVVRAFLFALDVAPARIPPDIDAQIGLYRTLLADRRLLVVLDNARDATQVRPLLPAGPGCVALVTSRDRLAGLVSAEGALSLTLDLLTDAEAGTLFARRVGMDVVAADPDRADDILDVCGRLPLAVVVAAARVTASLDSTLSDVARELRRASSALDGLIGDSASDLRAVFSWSYDALGVDAVRLFRLLGLHPGPDVSAPAAAALAGIPERRVRRVLAELAAAHLIREHRPGRYRLHDLLGEYAAELVHRHETDDDRRAATCRLVDHYLHTAHAAAFMLKPMRRAIDLDPPSLGVVPEDVDDHDRAFLWFTTERAVLSAVVEHAVRLGLDTHVVRLAWAVSDYLDRRGHWHDLVAVHLAALHAVSRTGDVREQARTHRDVARAYHRFGRLEQAQEHVERSLDLYRGLGDRDGQADAHGTYASILTKKGDSSEALRHAHRAIDGYRVTGNDAGRARMLNNSGWILTERGDYRQAVAACEEALALSQRLGHRHGQAVTWDSLGLAHHHLGDHRRAIDCYQNAIDLYEKIGDHYELAMTLGRSGETHGARGDAEASRRVLQRALEILEHLERSDTDDAHRLRRTLSHLQEAGCYPAP